MLLLNFFLYFSPITVALHPFRSSWEHCSLFSLKISLVSSQISLLTSVGFPFPRLRSRVRVGVDLVIVCPVVCCSYYSWTEALKLRNYELSCSQHPRNGFVYGNAWELLVSEGQWFITVPVVFHQLQIMNFGDKLLLLYSMIATSAFQLNGLPPLDQLFQAACVFQLEAFSQWKDFLSIFFFLRL